MTDEQQNDIAVANINGRLKALGMQRDRAETGEIMALARAEELQVMLNAARDEFTAAQKELEALKVKATKKAGKP